eukprot:5524854-Amphidinium_carterae.1
MKCLLTVATLYEAVATKWLTKHRRWVILQALAISCVCTLKEVVQVSGAAAGELFRGVWITSPHDRSARATISIAVVVHSEVVTHLMSNDCTAPIQPLTRVGPLTPTSWH